MPIAVLCPSCKARFQVSEKFAGKQGPCPKCKAPITIPAAPAEIQIHAPDAVAVGGKTSTGEVSLKPIARKETKVPLIPTVIAVCGGLTVLAIALAAGEEFQKHVIRAGLPCTWSRYRSRSPVTRFCSNDELEPHRGKWLWVRAAICGLGFTALWVAYWFIPVDLRTTGWSWFFIAPVLLSIGGGIAWACYDLDFGNGFMLCCFYAALTIALGWLAGLEMPWAVIRSR